MALELWLAGFHNETLVRVREIVLDFDVIDSWKGIGDDE
jgi:hypothetical protein